jgi:hypothetical protein
VSTGASVKLRMNLRLTISTFVIIWQTIQGQTVSLNKEELLRMTKFGISARENGVIILAGESYILHTTIKFAKWSAAMTEAALLATNYIREISTKFPGNTQPVEVKNAVQMVMAAKTQTNQMQTYYERRINAIATQHHPAWNKLLRYRTANKIDSPATTPARAGAYDIETITQCFDHQTIIQPSLVVKSSVWGTTVDKWTKAANLLNAQIRDMLSGLQQLQLVFEDLGQSKFPQTCITRTMWGSILKLMKIDDGKIHTETDMLLVRLANLGTTHMERNKDNDMVLHTILPILPDTKLQFALYYINVAPIPATKQRWHAFNIQQWLALNSDKSYQIQFTNLDMLNEGCISGTEIWWCFESFPVEKIDAASCITKALVGNNNPEKSCYGPTTQTPTVKVVDLTANRYLITSGRAATLKMNCKNPDGSDAAEESITMPAGNTIYSLRERCSAEISPYLLPTNWYVPIDTNEAVSIVAASLAEAPEDTTEDIGEYNMVCELQTESKSEVFCTTSATAKSNTNLREAADGKDTEANQLEKPAEITESSSMRKRSTLASTTLPAALPDADTSTTNIEEKSNSEPTTKPTKKKPAPKKKKDSQHSSNDLDSDESDYEDGDDPDNSVAGNLSKAANRVANQIIGTFSERLLNWLTQEFDFGDVMSIIFSVVALTISLIVILKDWCYKTLCNRTANPADGNQQFRKWLTRNAASRKQSTTKQHPRRSQPPTPSTHHVSIQPGPSAPARKTSNPKTADQKKAVYEMLPMTSSTRVTTHGDQESGSIIIRTFH